ncbi:MAG TPA: AI-2E family transporter [Acidimicrobiia bacterium]|nr:AI-2E family transporter [Acidimicrobiia bacterium]
MNTEAGAPGDVGDSEPWQQNWPPPSYWIKVGLALIAAGVALFLLGVLKGILLLVIASFVLAVGLQPAVAWLEERGLRRGLGLAVVLMAILVVVGGMVAAALPLIVSQVTELVTRLPALVEELAAGDGLLSRLAAMIDLEGIANGQTADPAALFDVVGSVLGGVFNFLTVLLVTPYFAMSMPEIKRWLVRLLRPHQREDFLRVLGESTDMMANFILGNLVVSLIAGVVTWVGLTVIGVPYALALAAFVAVTDLIPVLGALLGAIAVGIVAAVEGTDILLWALALVIVYQQIENFVIAPRVMNRAVDLSPAAVIIAFMVGGAMAGLLGALLALPIAAMLKLVINQYVIEERMDKVRAEVVDTGGMMERRRRRGARQLP